MAPRAKKWLKLLEEFVGELRIKSKEIVASDERGAKLELWESQHRFLQAIGQGLDDDVHSFNCLKSRQLGATTISLAIDVFWLAVHSNLIGCLVTDTEKNREVDRGIIEGYVASFPEGYFSDAFRIVKSNRQMLQFSNGSRLDLLVAGTKKKSISWGEGQGYALMHACMASGTPVITEHGKIKRIEDVVVGDKVLTHTGAQATVVDVCGQPNTKGLMIRICPWRGTPIYCTSEHTIPTARGLVEAADIRKDDLLVMPVRKIRGWYWKDYLPETAAVAHSRTERAGWVRVKSAGSGAEIDLNEEFGFAIGYYLAEGYLLVGPTRKPTGITFTRHRDESCYSDRAVKALSPFIAGSIKVVDRPGTLTTTVTVHGAALASWIDANFGRVESKHIPDDVFDFGVEFCRGLLAGLLCGDGSKTVSISRSKLRGDKPYKLNVVVLPTIHSSIATQARDLAASLGYGWGSISYESAGAKYGRMCKEQWRVCWSGKAAYNLRGLMGLSQMPSTGSKMEKCQIRDGQVYLKIRSIDTGFEEPMMWDLSVDHDDHTFRTMNVAVGNTEVAAYGDVEGFKSLEEGLAQANPNRLFIRESTAKGMNHWRTRWMAGLNDLTERSFFIGWWAGDNNRIPRGDPRFASYGLAPPTGAEAKMLKDVEKLYQHRVTVEQLAWFRWKQSKAGAEQNLLEQNQPSTAEDAFVQTGYSFFQVAVIGQDLKKMQDEPPIFDGYRYEVDGDFFHFKMIAMDPRVDDVDDVELKVWEEPVEGAQYVIGFDPAYGRNEHKDHHLISCFRCFADRMVQVAEYCTADVETKHAAWVLFHLCAAYRNSMANVELGGPGRLVMAEFDHLRQLIGAEMNQAKTAARGWEDAGAQARWYLYHKADSPGAGYMANFETNWRTKMELLHGYRGVYSSREIVIRSMGLLREMSIVVVNDGDIGAPESTDENMKDDRVFAAALASRAWTDWIRKDMIMQGLTYDVVMRDEAGQATKQETAVNSIVRNFLRTQEERANEEPAPPKWLHDQGLA